jgi:hypothetical protein
MWILVQLQAENPIFAGPMMLLCFTSPRDGSTVDLMARLINWTLGLHMELDESIRILFPITVCESGQLRSAEKLTGPHVNLTLGFFRNVSRKCNPIFGFRLGSRCVQLSVCYAMSLGVCRKLIQAYMIFSMPVQPWSVSSLTLEL